ncbi:MAG: hypothetical protein LBG69_03340 [Zoogloeaceae bacterium]|jgi:hypothetical protein|nr:hypothetical protein [Zoogloeaceae bacterium]
MPKRPRFLPLFSVSSGMALASPIMLSEHGRVVLNLPVEHTLTQANLAQLRAHHAQYVCVAEEDTRGQLAREQFETEQIHRLQAIFSGADMSDPDVRSFFDAVLSYRAA